MKAKLAYLTSPSPDRFMLHIQPVGALGGDPVFQFEISRAHLANIIIDGASFSLRESSISRVPPTQTEDAPHERAEHRA